MAQDIVKDLFEQAEQNFSDYEGIMEQRVAIRESLRNLKTAGVLSEAQAKQVDEIFPPRRRGEAEGE